MSAASSWLLLSQTGIRFGERGAPFAGKAKGAKGETGASQAEEKQSAPFFAGGRLALLAGSAALAGAALLGALLAGILLGRAAALAGGAALIGLQFAGAAALAGIRLAGPLLVGVLLAGTLFAGVLLAGTLFAGVLLAGALFAGVLLAGALFAGVLLALRGGTLALALRGLSCAAARLFAAATASQHGKGEQYRHKERADPYPIVFELTSCHKEHILALKFAVGNSVSL